MELEEGGSLLAALKVQNHIAATIFEDIITVAFGFVFAITHGSHHCNSELLPFLTTVSPPLSMEGPAPKVIVVAMLEGRKNCEAQPLRSHHHHCWLHHRASGCWERCLFHCHYRIFTKAWLLPSYCRRCMLRRRASTRQSGLPHSVLHLRVVSETSYPILTIIYETVVRKVKHDDGGCWFAWWCHNRESPEPPLRHQEFTVVSSHHRCSLSLPEFIRLPKTKPHPTPDLSSGPFPLLSVVGLLKFYLVGAAVRTGMMAEFRSRIVVTVELELAATIAEANGLGAYGVRVITDLVNK
ncbi:hypothetical protein PIB30_091048, partial [Stylosanthes scabra]|nr:hypothetical protein [Stylosanthes scabra]